MVDNPPPKEVKGLAERLVPVQTVADDWHEPLQAMFQFSQRFGNVHTTQVAAHWKWPLMQLLCDDIDSKAYAL